MQRSGRITADSYELRAAIGAPQAPAGGAPRPTNSALLADQGTVARLAALLGQLDSGALQLDTFRGRLQDLGLQETPEAAKMLRQPQAISFRVFMQALNSGNEALGAQTFGGGGGSAGAPAPLVPSHIDGGPAAARHALTAPQRFGTSAASVLSTQESGVGMLLVGRGDELAAAATQPEVGDAAFTAATHTHRARTVYNASQVPSGAHAALRGEAEALPHAATQPARERARHVLSMVDARALPQEQAERALCAALGAPDLRHPALAPLAGALGDFFASRARGKTLRAAEALGACEAWLAAHREPPRDAPPGPLVPAAASAAPPRRAPPQQQQRWSPQRAADFSESREDRGAGAPYDARVAARLRDPVAARNHERVFSESSGRLRDIHAVEVASAHLEAVAGGGGGSGGGGGGGGRVAPLLPLLNSYGVGGVGEAARSTAHHVGVVLGGGSGGSGSGGAALGAPEPLYAASGAWSGSAGAREAQVAVGASLGRRALGSANPSAGAGGGAREAPFLRDGGGEWPQREGGAPRIGGARAQDEFGQRSHFGGGAGGGGVLPGGGGGGGVNGSRLGRR
jgi:hypothetical protein